MTDQDLDLALLHQPTFVVHVIDDDAEVLASCGFLLGSLGIDAKLWESSKAFLLNTDIGQPAIVISDIMMPDMDGRQLHQYLINAHSPMAFIALTGRGEIADAVRMLKDGAIDYIEKPMQLSRLQEALARAAADTEQKTFRNHCLMLFENLTDKEKQIAQCLMQGKLNKVIADELNIAVRTVEVHRSHVMEKMQAHHLSDLLKKLLLIEN